MGDKVWPGRAILGLPDLSRMKVLTYVAETDLDKVHESQRVNVSLDAYPEAVFSATVTFVSLISHAKDGNNPAKVFDVEILLDETDPILRPGMTVSASFQLADLEKALIVPGDCLHPSGNGYALVVKTLFGEKQVQVDVLHRDSEVAVVEGDLSAGDRLIRRNGKEAS